MRQKITTKEELADLRARLDEIRGQASSGAEGEASGGKRRGWQGDIDDLALFLEDLKQVIQFLMKNRVLEDPRKLFTDCWEDTEVRIDIAIAQLRTIENDENPIYLDLHNAD